MSEYDDLPVRHNEDRLNLAMMDDVRIKLDPRTADDPHTKAHLLLQARRVSQLKKHGILLLRKCVIFKKLAVLSSLQWSRRTWAGFPYRSATT